ncbi:MAG: hypothetical protein AMXMBFR46_24100 [Acidimicrobiia bacterium]
MESVIEEVGEAVVGGFLQETVEELSGRSRRKWAVVLLAFVVGGVVAAAVIRSRRRRATEIAGSTDTDPTTPDAEEQP